MNLTLGKASKEVGKSKSTLLNAIKKGWLTAEKNEKGQWQINPAELFRVYPVKNKATETQPQQNTVELELYKQQITDLKQQVIDWKEQCEKWEKQAQTLAITNQKKSLFGWFK